MKAVANKTFSKTKNIPKKVSDLTVAELKSVIHEAVAQDMEAWRETFEILANKKIMKQIREADEDWVSGSKTAYLSWDKLKNV